MNHPRNDQIQQAINGWIGREWHWHRKMAVTLKILQYDNHGNPISEHAQDQSIRHFLKRLEATFYGSVLRKKGRRLQAFVVAETRRRGQIG